MQRHDGLAGTRTALDHEHAGEVGADDLVLLGLDRADDVAEHAGAWRLDRGDQGTAARQLVVGHPVESQLERGVAEVLVLEPQQGPAPADEVTAP